MPADYQTTIANARKAGALLTQSIEQLTAYRDVATAEIAKHLRSADQSLDLDVGAIQATLTRPYTLIPINEHEATLIHWRGVRMPLFGWVVKQEPAFTIARVSRGMGLLTPFPDWMKEELGWRAPEHAAVIDGTHTALRVTQGDEATFKRKYGAHLGAKQGDGAYRIKSGEAWIKLVAALVRDGILPYTPQPVAVKDWDPDVTPGFALRDYQQPFLDEFKAKGAVFFNLPPGAGKTFLSLWIMAHVRGRVLILAPSVILCEQWRERVKQFAPNADVTILTYASGKKALEHDWALTIFDEVQTLPADTFSKLAFLKTKYRIGLSASPWREDGRQYMIAALAGFPCAIRWADLIRAGVLKRPRVVIATVANEAAKTAFTRSLIEKRRGGRALIFCDYLEQGQQLANALDVPFVSGETPHKLERVQAADVCVVSRIADRGLDFTDLTLVVEWAFMGKSREQEAQRLGRLLHSQAKGEHYLLFTPDEAERFKPRIFGIESELAGEIDLEFITVGNVPKSERAERAFVVRRARPARIGAPRRAGTLSDSRSAPVASSAAKPDESATDEIAQALALRSVAVKIAEAEKSIGARSAPYVRRAFRYCYAAPLSPREIADALGIIDQATRSRISSACKALASTGLLVVIADEGRYRVNQDEIKRARALGALVK